MYTFKELLEQVEYDEESACNICPFKNICEIIGEKFCKYDEANDIINYLLDKWIEENPEPVLREIRYWTDFKDEEDYRKSVEYLSRNGYRHETFSINPNGYKKDKILSFTEGSKFVYYRFNIPEDNKKTKYIKQPQLFRDYIPEYKGQIEELDKQEENIKEKPKKEIPYKGFIIGLILGGALVCKIKG